jgi:hypothetical protein
VARGDAGPDRARIRGTICVSKNGPSNQPSGAPIDPSQHHRQPPSKRTRPICSAFEKRTPVLIQRKSLQQLGLCLLALIFAVPVARAEGGADDSTRAAARALGTQGIEAYWANDFQTANTKLDRAFRLYATSTLGLWSARARVQLGQLVAGAERYREALRAASLGDAEAQQKAQSEVRAELDKLTPRIPTLTVHISNARPDDVSVTLDSVAIPGALLDEGRPTDPGKHSVVATRGASGSERQQIEVQLREGEQRQLTIRFKRQDNLASEPVSGSGEGLTLTPLSPRATAADAPQPSASDHRATSTSPLRPLGIIVLSFGGAGLATAAITALIANSQRSECDADVCPPDIKQTYDTLRTVSMVAFYAGAGLAIGGLVMFLTAPKEDAAISLRLGPSGAALSGRF